MSDIETLFKNHIATVKHLQSVIDRLRAERDALEVERSAAIRHGNEDREAWFGRCSRLVAERDALLERARALVEKWRGQTVGRGIPGATAAAMTFCADELEAALELSNGER